MCLLSLNSFKRNYSRSVIEDVIHRGHSIEYIQNNTKHRSSFTFPNCLIQLESKPLIDLSTSNDFPRLFYGSSGKFYLYSIQSSDVISTPEIPQKDVCYILNVCLVFQHIARLWMIEVNIFSFRSVESKNYFPVWANNARHRPELKCKKKKGFWRNNKKMGRKLTSDQ